MTKEKTATVRLPLTRNDREPLFVSVNERTWLIRRGEEVSVPECVAEVLRNQQRAEAEAIGFEEQTAFCETAEQP